MNFKIEPVLSYPILSYPADRALRRPRSYDAKTKMHWVRCRTSAHKDMYIEFFEKHAGAQHKYSYGNGFTTLLPKLQVPPCRPPPPAPRTPAPGTHPLALPAPTQAKEAPPIELLVVEGKDYKELELTKAWSFKEYLLEYEWTELESKGTYGLKVDTKVNLETGKPSGKYEEKLKEISLLMEDYGFKLTINTMPADDDEN